MRVLVTGAASGIGRATCRRLARDAAARGEAGKLAAVDLAPSPALDDLVKELQDLGTQALPLSGDMGTADAPARVVAEALDRFGGLDGLVSNAGLNRPGPLLSYSVEDWDRLFAVNTRATWLLAQAAHPASRPPAAPSWPWGRCPAATPTPAWAPTGRARRPSSCSGGCWRRSSDPTASG